MLKQKKWLDVINGFFVRCIDTLDYKLSILCFGKIVVVVVVLDCKLRCVLCLVLRQTFYEEAYASTMGTRTEQYIISYVTNINMVVIAIKLDKARRKSLCTSFVSFLYYK